MAATSPQNRDRVRTISFYTALALLAYLLYVIARPFIVPLCAAAVLVIFFYPVHAKAERRYGKRAAALLSTLLVTTILIVPAVFVITAFVREATAAVGSVQDAIAAGEFAGVGRWWDGLQRRTPAISGTLSSIVEDLQRRFGGAAAETAGGILQHLGAFVFDAVVVIFAMFFLFRDAKPIMALVRRVLPFEEEQREIVIRQAHEIIRASVVSALVVACSQGVAGGLLFWALGLPAPVFWGVTMAFFSLLPVVGPWAVWLPAGIWLVANGSAGKGLLVLGLGAGIVSMIDNVLRPALLSERAQMNGLLVLVSVLGGIGAFGLIGVVIGPVVVATMTSLVKAYTGPAARGADRPGERETLAT